MDVEAENSLLQGKLLYMKSEVRKDKNAIQEEDDFNQNHRTADLNSHGSGKSLKLSKKTKLKFGLGGTSKNPNKPITLVDRLEIEPG